MNQKAAITELMPASSAPVWKKCFQKGGCLWWVHIYGFYRITNWCSSCLCKTRIDRSMKCTWLQQ